VARKGKVTMLNIDAARIAERQPRTNYDAPGRWPANVALDEESAGLLDAQSGFSNSGTRPPGRGGKHGETGWRMANGGQEHGDSGGASRFFYCAKASRAEREQGLEGIPQQDIRVRGRARAGATDPR
jgi:site-specific DNA-methyltransferase (adenine-specific)